MYYQNYEDYMRSILGYPLIENNLNTYEIDYLEDREKSNTYKNTKELENYYPEIYKILNPIVCDMCDRYNNTNITKDILENMTEIIYQKVITDNETIIKMNQTIENRQRRPNNPFLRDIIKILILNRILGGFFSENKPYIKPSFPYGGPMSVRPQR